MGGNPQVVVIAAIGVPVALFERLPSIAGNPEIAAYNIDIIGVIGIDLNLSVVVRSERVLEQEGPAFPGVIGAIDTGAGHPVGQFFVRFVGSYEDFGVIEADREVNIAAGPCGQAFFEFSPGFATVCAFVDSTVRPTTAKGIGLAQALVKSGKQHIGVAGLKQDIRAARFSVVGKASPYFLPGFAAVVGAKQPSFPGIAPKVARRSSIRDIGVGRVQGNRFDVPGRL